MPKILFVLNGVQQLVDAVAVTSDAQIIWHEHQHGPLPEGMELLDIDREDYEEQIIDNGKPLWKPQVDAEGNTIFQPLLDEQGQPVLDRDGKPVMIPVDSNIPATTTKYRPVFNPAKQAERIQRETAKETDRIERQTKRQEMQALRAELESETITSARLRRFLKLHFHLKGE